MIFEKRQVMRSKIVFLFMLFAIIGCNQQALIEKLTPKEEVEFSKQYLALFQARDFDAIERKVSPEFKNSKEHRQNLERLANLFPDEKVKNVSIVGSHTYSDKKLRRYDLSFLYEFPSKWIYINVRLEKDGDILVVKGVHIQPLRESPEITNRFTFQGKGAINYIFLILSILIGLFIIYAFVLCIKTPIPKKKWLWLILVLLSFIKFTLNWTTGSLNINLFNVQLLGSGFAKGGLLGPWLIETSVPLGAILFMLKRKKWLTPPVKAKSEGTLEETAGKVE
jgi:hypothetical protein